MESRLFYSRIKLYKGETVTTDLTNRLNHLRVFMSELEPYEIQQKLEELSKLSEQYIPLPKDIYGVVFTGDEKFFIDNDGAVAKFGCLTFLNGEWWLYDDERRGNCSEYCTHIQDEWAELYFSINGNIPRADKLKAFIECCKQLVANESKAE